MAEFNYFGFIYEIIDETKKEVKLLKKTSCLNGRVVIPLSVEYNGETYKVTAIGPRIGKVYSYESGLRETDRRKKNRWRIEPRWVCTGEDSCSPFVDDNRDNAPTLTSIFLPDSITCIGEFAFNGCESLKEITIPSSVKTIGERAFYCCESLESISLNEGITSIGREAFNTCNSLKEITIPSSVKTIGNFAFIGCVSLESISLNEGITCIGERAFCLCKSLKEITIPSSVKTIGEYAFDSAGIDSINIMNDEGNVIIAPNAFPRDSKINYLGKKEVKPESKPSGKMDNEESKAPVSINLDDLIQAVVADGVITDKERSVILKKATAAGYDADEVEILLDGKLAEKQNVNKVVVKESQEKVAPAKNEAPATKPTAKPAATEGKSSDGTRSKYAVNDTGSYGKGRMVEAVVNKYVELNPQTTVAKLKEVFPKRLQGSNFIKDSTEDIKDMKRYYESALPGGAKFYISNQWGNQTDGFVEYVNDNIEGITITKL